MFQIILFVVKTSIKKIKMILNNRDVFDALNESYLYLEII